MEETEGGEWTSGGVARVNHSATKRGRLGSETGSSSQTPRPEALASNSHKLDAVLAAVERIGTDLDQTQASLESKIDKVTSDLNLLHADHRKLADKTCLLEDTLSDLTPNTS
ncbi:hypothetical protein NDU88_005702 [Pleurodeles waltl]|uniref:Uncharacterized protein n=1 Tax=Pleurodeles waltl TaxID=8319 RepID=A0AAV7MA55_PLEWA|nr:hypothetical protein NDU88_005702 [Pleurodeles waltl]